MTDTVRTGPGTASPTAEPAVIATISIDVPLALEQPHAVLRRIDTIVRTGDTVQVITGAPAATPIPARIPDGAEGIATIHLGPWGTGLWPYQIWPLNVCCVCGTPRPHGRAFHENFEGRLFCWPCADGNRPVCPAGDACRGTVCERQDEHGPRPDPLCDCHHPGVPLSQHVDSEPADANGEPAPGTTEITDDERREQLRQAGAEIGAKFGEMLQLLAPGIRAAAERMAQLGQALQTAGLVDADGKPTRLADRPAWQSPYGPPRTRH